VERRRRRQQVQEENKEDGQDAQGHPDLLHQTGFAKLQSDWNLTGVMPDARGL
jgi:hypothetical protein